MNPYLSSTVSADPNYVWWGGDWNHGWFDVVNHRQWILELLERDVDMVWVSNWQEDLLRVNFLFDFPDEMGYIPLAHSTEDAWKLDSIISYVDERHSNAPIIWLDDEIGERGFEGARERPDTLLVKVDPVVGWSESERNDIHKFLDLYIL